MRNEKVIPPPPPPPLEGVKNWKKQTTEDYKAGSRNPLKNSLYVALLLLQFKIDL
jgi:hypothetical protein